MQLASIQVALVVGGETAAGYSDKVDIFNIDASSFACSGVPKLPQKLSRGFGGALDDVILFCGLQTPTTTKCFTFTLGDADWVEIPPRPSMNGYYDSTVVRVSGDRLWIVGGRTDFLMTGNTWMYRKSDGIIVDWHVDLPDASQGFGACVVDLGNDEFFVSSLMGTGSSYKINGHTGVRVFIYTGINSCLICSLTK